MEDDPKELLSIRQSNALTHPAEFVVGPQPNHFKFSLDCNRSGDVLLYGCIFHALLLSKS
jgi:hypothetical protein